MILSPKPAIPCRGKNFLKLDLLAPGQRPKAAKLALNYILGKSTGPDEFIMRKKSGDTVNVEISSYPMKLDGKSVVLGIARDITERRNAEARLQEPLLGLRKALDEIIQVLASVSEIRDPYTAGHQRRVADLARAIGEELGLAPDRVEGIRVAGLIHDIGKMSIPAEILSKPAALSKIEYALIQSHTQIGHDILREIEFTWPIS